MKGYIHRIVAQSKSEIGQKAIDLCTISHVFMGVVSYMLFFLFLGMFNFGNDILPYTLIGVLFWAIMWEYVENFLLAKTRLKIGRQKDSLQNSLTDVIFTGIGGILALVTPVGLWGFLFLAFLLMIIYNLVAIRVMG